MLHIQVPLEFRIRKFVCLFIFSISLWMFLNSIVCEVDLSVILIFKIKCDRTCSNVTFPIPIGSFTVAYRSDQHIMPDIKFPFIIQKRPVHIQLDNVGKFFSIRMFFAFCKQRIKLLQTFNNSYVVPSIRIFTWLDNPNIMNFTISILNYLCSTFKLSFKSSILIS